MSVYGNENWMSETAVLPEALVLNEDTRTVVCEFDSYGTAYAWIADTHDHQEDAGLPLSNYRIIPVRNTSHGRDIR